MSTVLAIYGKLFFFFSFFVYFRFWLDLNWADAGVGYQSQSTGAQFICDRLCLDFVWATVDNRNEWIDCRSEISVRFGLESKAQSSRAPPLIDRTQISSQYLLFGFWHCPTKQMEFALVNHKT